MKKLEQIEVLSPEVRAAITSEEIRAYATEASTHVMIRDYIHGTSYDFWRETNLEESAILKKILIGALDNIRYGRGVQETADAAEFIAIQFFADWPDECNTYDTIYLPIKRWCKEKINSLEKISAAG